jgi:hypothetical protein
LRGRKPTAKNRNLRKLTGKKPGGDESGTFKVDSEMFGGNPNGIDAVQALQMIGGGIAILLLIWYILNNILRII